MAFCSNIRYHFIRKIRVKLGILNSSQSPDAGQNLDGSFSNYRISDHSFINENFDNSETSHDTDTKPGLVTKLDIKNMATSKEMMMT